MNKLFAASQVNVIDLIVITEETNISNVLAEWSAFDPEITIYNNLTAAQAVKLFIKWSDQNGIIDLRQGDYFTFVIPDIFMYDLVNNVTDAAIKNDDGDIVATYSVYDNGDMKKELKITFTDYVETHTNISGELWLLLFVGEVDSTEKKNLEFIINGNTEAEGEVTIVPHDPYTRNPHDEKNGFSSPTRIFNDYYIFEWLVYLNMNKNSTNGFSTFENFSFDDTIPADSPHIFLTDGIRQELGILSTDYETQIGEYKGADSYPPENRYQIFAYHYNSTGADIWYEKIKWNPMVNGLTTVGIDGNDGLDVSDIVVADKFFSANLGTITRPTAIRYYTISTVKLAESALGDSEVARLFKNAFKGSTGEDFTKTLTVYRFESGGSAQGISGDYSFAFTKVKKGGAALPGAMFSLYISLDFTVGADRIAYSGVDGVVSFRNLPEGTFYVQETVAPYDYILEDTIYKVVLSKTGFEIYYGDNFENKLSDNENKILNRSKYDVEPVLVTLAGTKNLTGMALSSGMFSFIVKDRDGSVAATGTNNANGGIDFSEIKFDAPGVYSFTVEEVTGGYSGITYDVSKFPVTVTVTDDGSGKLTAEVSYPGGGVVFNNSYAVEPIPVTLAGTKNLTGMALSSGMFSFIVKDRDGSVAATGTNNANGGIDFSEIKFDTPGVYSFTVEEVTGGYSGITYDVSKFTVTVTVTDDGGGKLTAEVSYPGGGVVFNNSYAEKPEKPCQCYAKSTKCRKSIEGRKIWVDNGNAGNKRPQSVEIILQRDGEFYKSIEVDSAGDGAFIFCCVPIYKNSSHEYIYKVDEAAVPDGYTKTIDGYDVINTLVP